MNQTKLILISLASLVLGRSSGLCTSNGVADDLEAFKAETAAKQAEADQKLAELAEQNSALARQNADLQKQLSGKQVAPVPEEDNSTLAILCRHHGVDMANVVWRIKAGLSPAQAVEVAVTEKKEAELSGQ